MGRGKGSDDCHRRSLSSSKTDTEFLVPPGGMEQQHPKYHDHHTFILLSSLWGGTNIDPYTWWKRYWKGFRRDHYILALQTFVSYVIVLCIISPDAVYNALSYDGRVSPSWGLIYLLMLAILGGTAGMHLLLQSYALVSLVFSGCLGVLIRYLTYLAAGSDWDNNDFQKGVTNTLLLSFSCGVFNILRWKWDLTNVLFFMCSIFLVFNQGQYSGEGASRAYLTSVYNLINISLSTFVFTVVSWVLFPIYSSTKMRCSTSKALESLSKALSAEKDLMLGPIDEESGLLDAATGEIDIITCRDKGLHDKCQVIGDHVTQARACLLGNRSLRVPALLEIFIYRKHTSLTFPVVSFMHVDYYSHMLLSIITNLARPLKMGTTNLRKIQGEDIQKALNHLFASYDDILHGLAGAMSEYDDTNVNLHRWKSVDDLVELSHDCWLDFLREGQKAIKASRSLDEDFGLRIVSIFLYEVGSRLRELYFAVAIAMSSIDPSSLDIAFARIERRPAWILSRTAYEHLDQDPVEIIKNLGSDVSLGNKTSVHDKKWLEKTKKSIRKMQRDRNLSEVLASEFGVTNRSAAMRPRKAFRIPLWLIMGFQYFITVLIASILVVIPAVESKVFNKRGTDVVFTVVVLWQPNIGSLTSRAFNRVLGTGMAAVWSYLLLGITYGATGTTWESSAQKWLVSGFLAAIWGAFCMLNGARYKLYAYMWFVAGFTVALVTLSLLREPTPPWAAAGERLLNVIYGIFISWVVAMVVFPISAWRMVRDNYADACSALHEAIAALPALFEPANNPDDMVVMRDEVLMSPLSTLYQKEIGFSAMYRPFEQKKLADAMHLTNRARRIIAATSAFVSPAEKETFYLRKPKQIPKGRISGSIYSYNIFLDYVAQILSLKMEFFPNCPWKVTTQFYDSITASLSSMAKSMALLDRSVHKQGEHIDEVLESMEESCSNVESLVNLASEMLESFSAMSSETQDRRAPLQNAEILLVYLHMAMYLQSKAVILAASKSFMFTNPSAMEKVEKEMDKKDFFSYLDHGPEHIISQLMEKSHHVHMRSPASLVEDLSRHIKQHLESMKSSQSGTSVE